MNPKESSEVTVETLLALRQEPDALRLITEKLRVKEMGPADHIRTKHEVKAFMESGDAKVAQELLRNVRERLTTKQVVTEDTTLRQGQRMGT